MDVILFKVVTLRDSATIPLVLMEQILKKLLSEPGTLLSSRDTYPFPLHWGLSRQEYWSGLPCPPPGDLPNPGIEPSSPTLEVDSLPSEHQRSP